MTMQYDVKQAHLNSSGYLVNYGTRVKGMSFTGGASAGYTVLFDASSVPVSSSVTYAQSGNTVTVTKVAHGLTTGTSIGIHFVANGSGVAATDGTYIITSTGANTFTLTDINSRTITSTNTKNTRRTAPSSETTPQNWRYTFVFFGKIRSAPAILRKFANGIRRNISIISSGAFV